MSLKCENLAIPDVKILQPVQHGDHRGFFSETYSARAFSEVGISAVFVQDNHSLSADAGTLRGLHFQIGPFAQDKLVRVTQGSIFDVVVDIRAGSPTYGQHVSAIISAKKWNQIWVPKGFAHGLVTLEPNTQVLYKVTNFYAADCDKGLLWNDPDLDIDWPVAESDVILSEKDKAHPKLSNLPHHFSFED